MAKYSITITSDDVDDIRRIAVLAAIVTYGDKDKYDYPSIDEVSNGVDWVLEQFLGIANFAYENEEVEEMLSYLERKIPYMRANLTDPVLESMTNA